MSSRLIRRRVALSATLALAALQGVTRSTDAQAQRASSGEPEWPTRPIRVLVPFAPGSATDTMARLLEPRMTRDLGQPLVIENRAGAGGAVGSQAFQRAPRDGHSLLYGSISSHAIAPLMMQTRPYDPVEDFTPIGRACTSTNFILVHPSVPARTLPELVELSKRTQGGLSFAAGGRGSSNALTGEMLKQRTGANLTHIPYTNIGQGVTDVVAGHVPMLIYTVAVMPHVKAGRLNAIAVTADRRQSEAPDVPTAIEQGLAGFTADPWFGLFGPPGLPDRLRDRLHAALQDALQDAEIARRLRDTGLEIAPLSSQPFKDFIRGEIDKWAEVVRASGMTMDN